MATTCALGLIALGASATTAVGQTEPRVDAPSVVTIGQIARIEIAGFPSRTQINLSANPLTAGNGGPGVRLGSVATDEAGSATVRVRWPRRFFVCSGAEHCSSVPAPTGAHSVFAASDGATVLVGTRVRVRPAPRRPHPQATGVRITQILGALAGPGTVMFTSVRFCDGAGRPASFRLRYTVYRRPGEVLARHSKRVTAARACRFVRLGIPVPEALSQDSFFRLTVINLRTGRQATRRSGSPSST